MGQLWQRMKYRLGIGLVVAVGLSACPGDDGTRLVITGSSTVAPLVSELGKAYEAENPGVRIDVQTGGSSRGVADVRQGVADLGMISRALAAEEADLRGDAIALDGISLILHQDNGVRALTSEQVAAIFTGEIDNWQELGGADAPITVVNKAEGRATLELFLAYFQLRNGDVQADVVIGDNQQGVQTVAGNVNAIAYLSIGAAQTSQADGIPIQLITIDGIEPSPEAIEDGSFPLVRPLQLVSLGTPAGLAADFINFAQSAQVHDLVKQQSFIPIPARNSARPPAQSASQ